MEEKPTRAIVSRATPSGGRTRDTNGVGTAGIPLHTPLLYIRASRHLRRTKIK